MSTADLPSFDMADISKNIACEGLKHYEDCDVWRQLDFIAMS